MATRKFLDCRFKSAQGLTTTAGAAFSGTASVNNEILIDGVPWEVFIIGTQTAAAPNRATTTETGLDWKGDDGAAGGDGYVLTPYGNNFANPLKFTIGTDPAFYMTYEITVADVSGLAVCYGGFHGGSATMQAHQTVANIDAYTDKAVFGWKASANPVALFAVTALNDAADVQTDSTVTLADGVTLKVTVSVSATGAVTYAASKNGTAQTLTTVAYTFDSGDVVVPYLYFYDHTDTPGSVVISQFTCGYQ